MPIAHAETKKPPGFVPGGFGEGSAGLPPPPRVSHVSALSSCRARAADSFIFDPRRSTDIIEE